MTAAVALGCWCPMSGCDRHRCPLTRRPNTRHPIADGVSADE